MTTSINSGNKKITKKITERMKKVGETMQEL